MKMIYGTSLSTLLFKAHTNHIAHLCEPLPRPWWVESLDAQMSLLGEPKPVCHAR